MAGGWTCDAISRSGAGLKEKPLTNRPCSTIINFVINNFTYVK